MKPDPKRIRELFVAALGTVDPRRWETFLEDECGGVPELPGEVRLLLEAHREAGSRRVPGLEHHYTPAMMNHLAELYEDRVQYEQAKSLFTQGLEIQRKILGGDHPRTAATKAALGSVLLKRQQFSEAEPILRASLSIHEAKLADDWSRFNTQSLLGVSLLGPKKYDEAEPLLLSGYDGMKTRETTTSARFKVLLTAASQRVVHLYEAWGMKEKAEEWRARIKATSELPANLFAP